MKLPSALLLVFAATTLVGSGTRTVTILADRDATLIEDPAGGLANGTGPLFVGRTGQSEGFRRRALIRFDLEHELPRNAIVESVELTLVALTSNLEQAIRLHRVQEDWSEGSTFSSGGSGGSSQPGDATWIHTIYPSELWRRPGGRYVARPSATRSADRAGPLPFTGPGHMLEDVRLWQHAPSRNLGWILVGDETRPQTVTKFASREDSDAEQRPRLTIRYRLPGPW